MNDINNTIIKAVIKKAESACPDSLALIGVYGSAATGDEHEKSDLDLLIIINDESGQVLADGFILDDIDVGYDIYCTGWDMLERDAQCRHAHLSKLLDSKIVYCRNSDALKRLDDIRKRAAELLSSDKRYALAADAYGEAKKMLADAYLSESLSTVRSSAGAAVELIENAVMLYNGRYFKKGTKRAFDELSLIKLPFDLKAAVIDIISADTVGKIRERLKVLLVVTGEYLQPPEKREPPCAENLKGTYEEMYSNWKNKMSEAADRKDIYSSFMNLLYLQNMLHEISQSVAVDDFEIMDKFEPDDFDSNTAVFNRALSRFLAEYDNAGICPKRYANVQKFAEDYCKEAVENDTDAFTGNE